MPNFVRIASVSDIPKGQGRTVEHHGKKIAVFNTGGTFYAINDVCKHQGGPLGEGELQGTVVTCPWHGWTYDVSSGVSPDDPDCAIETYPVKVEGNDILVGL